METHFPPMDDARRARERVIADLKSLASDSEALLKATAETASEKVNDVRARLAATVERAKASCDALQAQSLESLKESLQKADDTIRTHPYQSIGVAFGIGLLLGAVLRQR
jgi:ElaB/YqjD/DUF883 family membrane-anchored ribosome-binding protein